MCLTRSLQPLVSKTSAEGGLSVNLITACPPNLESETALASWQSILNWLRKHFSPLNVVWVGETEVNVTCAVLILVQEIWCQMNVFVRWWLYSQIIKAKNTHSRFFGSKSSQLFSHCVIHFKISSVLNNNQPALCSQPKKKKSYLTISVNKKTEKAHPLLKMHQLFSITCHGSIK